MMKHLGQVAFFCTALAVCGLLTACSTQLADAEVATIEESAPVESESVPAPEPEATQPQVSQCELDFQEAAAVPLSQTNDHILAKTLSSCSSASEWKSTLEQYPLVLGVSSASQQEIDLSFELICSNFGSGSTIC